LEPDARGTQEMRVKQAKRRLCLAVNAWSSFPLDSLTSQSTALGIKDTSCKSENNHAKPIKGREAAVARVSNPVWTLKA